MKRIEICLWTMVVLLTSSWVSFGQVATGTPQFASFGGGPFDIINLGNLNVHFAVPILHKAGRGVDFSYDLSYDSSVWYPVVLNGNSSWQPVVNWGWRGPTEMSSGYVTFTQGAGSPSCFVGGTSFGMQFTESNWTYHDATGTPHAVSGTTTHYVGSAANCPADTALVPGTAVDGSGWVLSAVGTTVQKVTSASGKVVNPVPVNLTGGTAIVTDANGNQITVSGTNQFFDTLSSTTPVLTVSGSGTPASPTKFGYVPPANIGTGTRVNVQVNYLQYTVKTNFGATDGLGHAIGEFGSTSVPLVSNITLPDGTAYSFLYEHTPGTCTPLGGTFSGYCVTARIASVTLPTGGQITYAYSSGSNGIINDGSTAALTRTLSPGGSWSYTRSQVSGNHWSTTVTAPDPVSGSNITFFDFAKDSATTSNTNNFYEMQRIVDQGSSTTLKVFFNCYNNNFTNCTGATVSSPIAKLDAYEQLVNSGNSTVSETTYDNHGLPTDHKDFDWGQALLRETVTTYNHTLGNGIVDRPSSVVLKDNSGSIKAQTNYTYDETTPTATSGTPQHIAISGSRGNVTTVAVQANGTTTLYRKFAYYDTGTLVTSTGLSTSSGTSGPITTYNYSAGSGSCGNSFVTSINEPLTLSRSMTWDCTGGVMLSSTDENGKIASVSYTDQNFWRPASITDKASNVTTIAYLSSTRAESTLTFNSGNSVSDHLTQLDGFGRQIVSQTKQGPSSTSYDSVETDYDVVGRVSKVSMPYSGSAGALCSGTCPGKTFSYDALGRLKNRTDAGGGTATYTYTDNYVNQTLGPAPAGENTKRKELVVDGIGRLASVCEITSGTGAGVCARGSSPTGYWTTYVYDVLNNLASVSQNAQAAVGSRQSRTYIFDMVGRLTTETNPETGTTSYTYDTDSTCSSTSAGDMVRRVAAGSTTSCYYYDSLHRTTAINYPTGCSRFVYDAATVNGIVMQNAKGRLAETSTDACAPPFNVTEEGFSYTSRGEVATVYQSTPHSGGYYTLNSSYWPNGALNTLSGIGLPTITYGPDGEGRPKTVSASSGQNPVTATSYNANSQVTSVTLGSGDAVTNGFDPNTGRQTSYAEAINGSTISGTLTWNPNGTLNHLVVADPFNASDVQTCNYSHDDLTRIASANCGTPWSQTFTYDPFGNLTKNGSITWNPGYNTATNHYTLGGTTYDATGNLLNDTFHTYTWHVDGRPLTVDAISLTHDAQGRIVEKNNGGVFTEYVYSAGGNKIAIMNGQTLVKGLVPLPGRIQATYDPTNSGYRIPDWLGTVRFASNANRTYSSSEAFAPFGERYSTGGSAPSNYTFTGMINSTVSDEYDFLFRSLQTSQGRWISPDPAGLAAVNLVSPQSWNRYAYVLNNPLSLVDPLGLACSTDPCPPGREPGAPEPGGGGGSDGSGGSSDPSPPGFPKPEQPPGREGGGGGGILRQAMQNATVALENKYCAGVVDGGKGFASSTLASNFAAMNGTSDPAETASFGTITSDNLTGSLAFYGKKGVGGTTTTTAPIYGFLPSGTRVFSGWMSTIIMNSNPLGLFMNPSLVSVLATGTGTGYSNQTFQTIELLHELGHGSALFGAPSAVVSDGDDLALSGQNTQAIENGCFPQGDFGGNQGPIASPPTAVPAIARPHRIR